TLQVKDFFGLTVPRMPEHFIERLTVLTRAMPSLHFGDLAIGIVTLLVLITLPRVTHRIPAPLIALPLAAVIAYFATRIRPDLSLWTIRQPFPGGIPSVPPSFCPPWRLAGPDGAPLAFSMDLVRSLAGSAFAIAMLGAIESLLSAVIADGMTGRKHDPDSELF